MLAAENRAFELVASALSEEYGVRVICSGLRANSHRDANGLPVINIPAIPLHDPAYRLLCRGYIDHEVGHVRFTDSAAIDATIMSHLDIAGSLKAVHSLYEDIYADRLMSECFVGCRRNLRKLALYLYADNGPEPPDAETFLREFYNKKVPARELPRLIWHVFLHYLLLASRSVALPKLAESVARWRAALIQLAPGLTEMVEPILARLPELGDSTDNNLALALETIAVVQAWLEQGGRPERIEEALQAEFPWLLRNGGEERELMDMGVMAVGLMDEIIQETGENLDNQINCQWHSMGSDVWQERLQQLAVEERKEALQASAKMAAQMQALLQSYVINRDGPFRQGKLKTRHLHKLFIGRDDIFDRRAEHRDINTEIALCIDMSGSMRFNDKAIMASKALYAVAESLAHIQGLNLHIIGFYDNHMVEIHSPNTPLNPRMAIVPDGGTLCGAAAREAAQRIGGGKRRKIIIMITDGDANDPENFQEALAELRMNGLEFLGVGIQDEHILEYLPPEECCIINDLSQLAASILAMMRKKIGIA